MNASHCALALAFLGVATIQVTAASSPAPYGKSVQHLQQRMRIMLKDVAHHNQQAEVTLEPDKSGLRTIVRVTARPNFRSGLSNSINQYINIHKGDCRPNTVSQRTNVIPLNPIANGVSETTVNVPLSTLMGHGNVVTTTNANGTVVSCGSL